MNFDPTYKPLWKALNVSPPRGPLSSKKAFDSLFWAFTWTQIPGGGTHVGRRIYFKDDNESIARTLVRMLPRLSRSQQRRMKRKMRQYGISTPKVQKPKSEISVKVNNGWDAYIGLESE